MFSDTKSQGVLVLRCSALGVLFKNGSSFLNVIVQFNQTRVYIDSRYLINLSKNSIVF